MTGVLYQLARFCVRRRWVVLAVWLVATVALVAVSHRLGDNTNDNLSLPGTDSQHATNVLKSSFPAQANGTSPIVIHAKTGKLTDQNNANAVNQAAANLSKNKDVAAVVNPLTPQGASALSKDQATGYISVTLAVSPGSLSESEAQTIIDAAAKPAHAAGLQVETGGQLGQKVSKPSTESSELVGIIAAMVILTITFGTVTSMLLPIVTAIFALLSTLAVIRMLGHVATVPTVAPTLATMIGLGVGIDYALFIVTRHFRGLHDGLAMDESIARAAATSGGAVFFAGGTVTIALVSLAVAGIPLVTTMGLMAAISVVIAVLAALTLLPAELALLGPRINSLRVRHPATDDEVRNGLWARWAREIAKQPVIAGLAALAILIPLTIPLLSLTLGQQDTAALSTSTTARRAYDLISENFGPGVNGPLLIAVTLGSPAQNGTSDPRLADAPERRRPRLRVWRRFRRCSSTRPGRPRTSTRSPRPGPRRARPPTSSTCSATARFPAPRRAPTCTPTWAAAPPATIDLAAKISSQAAAPDRRRDRAQLPAAHLGVPHGGGAAAGGRHEPALDRRLVRRADRDLPVRVG